MKHIPQFRSLPVVAATVMAALSLVGSAGHGTAKAQCAPMVVCTGSSLPITFETYPPARTGFPALPTKDGDKIASQYAKQGVRFGPAAGGLWLEIFTPGSGTQSGTHAVTLVRSAGTAPAYSTSIKGSCGTIGGTPGRTPSVLVSFVSSVWPDIAAPRKSVSLYTGLAFATSTRLNAVLVAHRIAAPDLVFTRALYGTVPPKPGIRSLMTVSSMASDIVSAEVYLAQAICSNIATTVPLPAVDDLSWN